MTNEEAIEILRKIPVGILDLNNEDKWDLTEAIEIAINALSLYKKEPLTLEQLREMDEQPVWVKCLNSKKYTDPPTGWRIVERSIAGTIGVWNGESCFAERDYGRTWLAYAYPPIDREAWAPCEFCEEHENPEEVSMLTTDEYESDRGMFIYNGILASNSGEFQMRRIDYCPVCGRPLTEEAWVELEKRIRGW